MEKDIIGRLEEEIVNFTKLQKRVSDYILRDPMQAAFSTVDQLAHAIGVSTTTVVRLAAALGFTGYAEFQKELQEYLKTKASPSNKLELNVSDDQIRTDIDETITEITRLQVSNIDKTYSLLTNEQLEKVERLISNAGHIYICGSRSCYSVAYHLNYNLERMFGKADLLEPDMGKLTEALRRVSSNDILISMSMARYNRIVVDVTRILKEKGCQTIVITDGYNSPLAQYADVLLLTHCKSVDFHNSMVATSYLCEIIIGICTVKNPQMVKKNLKELEKYLNQLNLMMQK